jgi:hypothetical protein
MKHKLIFALTIALVILSLQASQAAAQNRVKVNIPFDFVVADNHFPAGPYLVIQVNRQLILLRHTTNSTKFVSSIVTPDYDELRNQQTPALVFRHIGRQYFLAQFWLDRDDGVKVPQCSAEKEVLRASRLPDKVVLAEK